eukprot:1504321-Prymnesium_polylepis.1
MFSASSSHPLPSPPGRTVPHSLKPLLSRNRPCGAPPAISCGRRHETTEAAGAQLPGGAPAPESDAASAGNSGSSYSPS